MTTHSIQVVVFHTPPTGKERNHAVGNLVDRFGHVAHALVRAASRLISTPAGGYHQWGGF